MLPIPFEYAAFITFLSLCFDFSEEVYRMFAAISFTAIDFLLL